MAKFEIGHKQAKGRPPGSRNKRTLEFRAVLDENQFDPATELLTAYDVARECFNLSGRDEKPVYLRMVIDVLKEITSYSYPKLKSIDLIKSSPLQGLTPEEKLEKMRSAIEMLEMQIKDVSAK